MSPKTRAPLLPAYLIAGEDSLKREAVLSRLRARLAQEGDLSCNSASFKGEEATGDEIVTSCNTIPFASNWRMVSVSHVDKLKKADEMKLVEYLKAPTTTTVLALEAQKMTRSSPLCKAVAALGPQAVIDCSPPRRNELPSMIRSMARNYGINFTARAAQTLLELAGEDTVRLDNEVRKISLAHRGTDDVNENEVYALVARTAEIKPWEFVNAFSARDLNKCLLYLQHMESISPHALMAMCTTRLRELVAAKSLDARGNLSSLAAVLKTQDWRVKNHGAWARLFTSRELEQAFSSARDAEQRMKSSSDADQIFLEWVIEVLRPQAGDK